MVDILHSETSTDRDWNIGLGAAVREVALRNVECRLPGASHMGESMPWGKSESTGFSGQKYTSKSENIKDARGNIQEHSDPECFKLTMWAGFELSEPCHHFWFPSLHSQASPVKSMQDSLVFPQPKYHWFLGSGYYRRESLGQSWKPTGHDGTDGTMWHKTSCFLLKSASDDLATRPVPGSNCWIPAVPENLQSV